MKKQAYRAGVVLILIACFVFFRQSGAFSELSLENLKASRDALLEYYEIHPIRSAAAFLAIYILTTAVSIPGAAILSLAGGAIFGIWLGTALVCIAATIGATLAFLTARFVLKDWVHTRFPDRSRAMDNGIQKEGARFLFALRLVPLFPYWVVNLVMGVTPIRTWTYFVVSLVGMLPSSFVYVYAGTQLVEVDSPREIFSPELILCFVILGIIPLFFKRAVRFAKSL